MKNVINSDPNSLNSRTLHLGEQSRWRYAQIHSKQSYHGTQCTKLVGLVCCLGGRLGNKPTQQSGGRFGRQMFPEAFGLTHKAIPLLLPNSDNVA
jgi:hypothetical protein